MTTTLIAALCHPAAKTVARTAGVTPTWIVSLGALAFSVFSVFIAGRRARLDRQRQVFADAFDAVMRYREYPFIVLRRNGDEPAKERQRISAELSELQAKLNGFKGRLLVEDRYIGDRYVALLAATRRVAGTLIRDAWNQPAVNADGDVHNPGWDLSELDFFDEAYLTAVASHHTWLPNWLARHNSK